MTSPATEVESPGLQGLQAEVGLGDEAVDETGWVLDALAPGLDQCGLVTSLLKPASMMPTFDATEPPTVP
jgi:hypothetical protein